MIKYFSNLLTIIAPVGITGLDGNVRWFRPYSQYFFEDKEWMPVSCQGCPADYTDRGAWHYKIRYDDIVYYIPDLFAVQTNVKTPRTKISARNWLLHQMEQPKDYMQVFKDITGIDLRIRQGRSDNGYDVWLRAHQLLDGKLPSDKITETEDEDNFFIKD